MTEAAPIAFYAPLKSPHHPAPSGDRTMARLLLKALERAGFAPDLASELRTFDGPGDAAAQERLRIESAGEAPRLLDLYGRCGAGLRPRLWSPKVRAHRSARTDRGPSPTAAPKPRSIGPMPSS